MVALARLELALSDSKSDVLTSYTIGQLFYTFFVYSMHLTSMFPSYPPMTRIAVKSKWLHKSRALVQLMQKSPFGWYNMLSPFIWRDADQVPHSRNGIVVKDFHPNIPLIW
jgi:hypothetical protein